MRGGASIAPGDGSKEGSKVLEKFLQKGMIIPDGILGDELPVPGGHAPMEVQSRRETTWTVEKLLGSKSTTYLWLPYAPGHISYVESEGLDVLSGTFSGCFMASYTRDGGRRVCHVDTAADSGGPAVKEKWASIKEESTVNLLKEFKPFDHYSKGYQPGGVKVYGLITAEEGCYMIATTKVGGNKEALKNRDKVLSVVKV